MKAKISVIIPCFNYGHLIDETLISIFNQTYQNFEIIVVDDGSTDNTEEIVSKIVKDNKKVLYYKQDNAGPSTARNLGVEKSCGDFIQFLDADDLIEKRKFELQLRLFDDNPALDIVYGS